MQDGSILDYNVSEETQARVKRENEENPLSTVYKPAKKSAPPRPGNLAVQPPRPTSTARPKETTTPTEAYSPLLFAGPSGNFTPFKDDLQRVRGSLQTQMSQGLSDSETARMRNQGIKGIGARNTAQMADLARRQRSSGVTGGIAFAQQQAVNRNAMGARTELEDRMQIRNFDIQRSAQNRLEDFARKERLGTMSEDYMNRQMEMAQKMEDDKNGLMSEYIRGLNGQQSPSLSIPSGDRSTGIVNTLNPLTDEKARFDTYRNQFNSGDLSWKTPYEAERAKYQSTWDRGKSLYDKM